MKFFLLIVIVMTVVSCASNSQQSDIETVREQIDSGEFSEAESVIESVLEQKKVSRDERREWLFESERMERIRKDFTKTRQDVLDETRYYVSEMEEDSINKWIEEGRYQFKIIDGDTLFFNRAVSNVFHVHKDAREKLTRAMDYFTKEPPLYEWNEHHGEVMEAAQNSTSPYVKPMRAKITQSVTVDANAVPHGEKVRVWIPFPREIENRQMNVNLIETSHTTYFVAPEKQMQRTIYMEDIAEAGKELHFEVAYEYTSNGFYAPLSAETVQELSDEKKAELDHFLSERLPHIEFTDELKEMSADLIGDETNPFIKAKMLFDYVDAIPWAGAMEYSTIRNLGKYAFETGQADCGQVSMLLMTLFRMNGIPARWQSGWEFSPESFDTMHDWMMAYFEPYGWVPVDVTHGKLQGAPDEKSAYFYLGGMDSYRVIFNDDYSREFNPEKKHFRSETVDSQRGEVEWRGGNIYFDKWSYDMEWEFTPVE